MSSMQVGYGICLFVCAAGFLAHLYTIVLGPAAQLFVWHTVHAKACNAPHASA